MKTNHAMCALLACVCALMTACGSGAAQTESEQSETKQALEIEVSEQQLTEITEDTTEAESEQEVSETETETDDTHVKLYTEKNTDIDLSKIKIGDYDYDFGTVSINNLLKATNTRKLGFATLSVQYDDFNCTAEGFGRFAESETLPNGLEYPDYGSYGSTYYLECSNEDDAFALTFASGDVGDDFQLIFADGNLVWKEDMPFEEAKAVLGEGKTEDRFVLYSDGETMLTLKLDMFEDTIDTIFVYDMMQTPADD